MLILTAKHRRAFETCPSAGVLHGADVRNRTAMGILETGRRSIPTRREGGWRRNVNKDCVKAGVSSFILSFFLWLLQFIRPCYFLFPPPYSLYPPSSLLTSGLSEKKLLQKTVGEAHKYLTFFTDLSTLLEKKITAFFFVFFPPFVSMLATFKYSPSL